MANQNDLLQTIRAISIVVSAHSVQSGEIAVALDHKMADGDFLSVYIRKTAENFEISDAGLLRSLSENNNIDPESSLRDHGLTIDPISQEIIDGPFQKTDLEQRLLTWLAFAKAVENAQKNSICP